MQQQPNLQESIENWMLRMEGLFKEFIAKQLTTDINASNYLTVQEASDLLCIAKPTLYNRVSKREIPHFKKGKRLLFKRSDLITLIEGSKRKTYQEILEESKQRRAKLKN